MHFSMEKWIGLLCANVFFIGNNVGIYCVQFHVCLAIVWYFRLMMIAQFTFTTTKHTDHFGLVN